MQKKSRSLFQRFRFATSWVILLSVLMVIISCNSCSNSTGNSTATTVFGDVKGSALNDALIWKGIPYAKPPVGALRWKAPVDPDAWTGVREATSPCSACSQQVTDKFWRASNSFIGSEDCLCLNIYRPETGTTGLPVFVWIHGGANVLGSAQDFDGTALAKRGNLIVVIIQYRLSMLGWLTHPALRASGITEDKSGNYGTLDTMKALAWVQDNIAAFGGDPAKVTVGGQSAGGAHVMNLIISPLTNNFQKAFAESPALSETMPLRTLDQGDTESNAIIDFLLISDGLAGDAPAAATYRAGMSNAQIEDYLRSKTVEQIFNAALYGPGAPYGAEFAAIPAPTGFMDGTVLPETSWLDTINSGSFKKVPLIIGNTQYEFKDLMTLSASALKHFLNVPSGTNSWNDLYSVLDGTKTLNEVLPTDTDQLEYEKAGLLKSRKWQVECNAIARAIKTNDAANTVYSYLFNWAGGEDPALADFTFIFGASHAQDIAFFFGESTDLFKGYSFTAANKAGRVALQGAMMDYLTSYVNTGNPNPSGSSLPAWTQWSNTTSDPKFITFDADLNSVLISMDSTETTKDIVDGEIQAVLTANTGFSGLFSILGI